MAGRKPIPIEQHKLKGTYQPCRHAATHGTDPDHGTPDCPETLSDPAKAAWARFVPLLAKRRVLTLGDCAALEVLCETFAEWQELKDEIRTEGRTYTCATSSGAIMQRANPKVAMLSDAQRRLNVLFSEFGLTAASRGKIPSLSEATPGNKFAGLGGSK